MYLTEEGKRFAKILMDQVCMLNARLATAESMTHDVIRDLLGVKLEMTNYAVSCELRIFYLYHYHSS